MSGLDVEKKGNNTFEFKIWVEDDDGWSTVTFIIDGCSCKTRKWVWQECMVEIMYDCIFIKNPKKMRLYVFYLNFQDARPCPLSYTFSILDRKGRVFFTSKGKVLNNGTKKGVYLTKKGKFVDNRRDGDLLLSIIDVSYLEAYNLIDETGSFTVRFSADHLEEGSHPTKDRDDVNLLETLSNDFSTFYENKMDTDCVLRVSDAQFHVHRSILSARSSVFSAMFHHDTTESRSGEVNIPDVKAKVLGDVLYYVYSGKIKGLTANTAMSMYTAADKYDLPALRTECFEFLKCNLTLDNFCEVALLAHTHGEVQLEERVVGFIEENLDEVLKSNTWQQFLKDKTLLANKLLTSGFKISKKKLQDKASK